MQFLIMQCHVSGVKTVTFQPCERKAKQLGVCTCSTQKPAPTNRSPRSTFKVRSVNEGDLSARRLAEEVAGDANQDGQLRRPALWNPVHVLSTPHLVKVHPTISH
jgi:hypothetical protein